MTNLLAFCLSGSSHSDKEPDGNTPEKHQARTPSDRKRKRKTDDIGGPGSIGGPAGGPGGTAVSKGGNRAVPETKKINEYFAKHPMHTTHPPGTSPIRHGGAKSPSPQQGYPMVCCAIEQTRW